jgi:hypothetical protein
MENNKIQKFLKLANELENQYDTELLLSDDLVKQDKYLKGINKIELMGGDYPMIEDFLNIDFEAKKGIKGSVLNVSRYIPNTKKLIIMNNPYFKKEFVHQFMKQYPSNTFDNPDFLILDFLFKEINQISEKESYLLMSGTPSNKFFNKIKEENKAIINELQNWDILIFREKLPAFYQDTEFYRTNGKSIKGNMKINLLKKNQ